jgi:putative transposase
VSGAHRHDVALLEPTLDRVVIPRPAPQPGRRQHLCGDKGYSGQPADQAVRARRYVPHIPQRGGDPKARRRPPHARARRWVVERTHSWVNRFRKLLVRFEKTAEGHEGLLELACALITYRQIIPIHR